MFQSISTRNLRFFIFQSSLVFLSIFARLHVGALLGRDGQCIDAADKRVLVIGGGDTGNDCIGTAMRQNAKSVVNFELLPKPPKGVLLSTPLASLTLYCAFLFTSHEAQGLTVDLCVAGRAGGNPWPQWPRIYRVDYGHTEVKESHGADPRHFSVLTKRFVDDGEGAPLSPPTSTYPSTFYPASPTPRRPPSHDYPVTLLPPTGNVSGVDTVQIKWDKDPEGRWLMKEIEGSQQT